MTNPILLDTHVALLGSAGKLSAKTMRLLDDAADAKALLLSPIVAWEIGMLVFKRRLQLAMPVGALVRQIFGQRGVVTAAFSTEVALAAATIPDLHGDPADRILVATAAAYGASLVTRDNQILAYAKRTGAIRCVAC